MFMFVDTETTGLPRAGEQPRIVSLAWMAAERSGHVLASGYTLIKPCGFSIPQDVVRIHGISTEHAAREGRPLRSVLSDFSRDLARTKPGHIVAHNIAFDLPVIDAEYTRIGATSPCSGLPRLCTMMIARKRWPGESARLGEVFRRVFTREMVGAHNAQSDVRACAEIFFTMQRVTDAAPDAPTEDVAAIVDAVLDWATRHPQFDTGFVESLQDQMSLGRTLSARQLASLETIVERWRIPV